MPTTPQRALAHPNTLRATSWLAASTLAISLLSGCGAGSAPATGNLPSSTQETVAAGSPSGAPALAATADPGAPGSALVGSSSPSLVGSSAAPLVPKAPPAAGSPLTGLDSTQRGLFFDGKEVFGTVETIPNGLGPVFNGKSCAECHSNPVMGATSGRFVTRFGMTLPNGTFDPMINQGGSLLQAFANPGKPVEKLPSTANTVTPRRSNTLLGAGLIEAIPDAALVANANQEAAANPKMAGQVVMVTSVSDGRQHVGRFGWKCQQALLLDFSADAYFNELGVSSNLFPFKNHANEAPRAVALADIDDTPDPISGLTDHEYINFFMRYLAPNPNPVVAQDSMDFPTTNPLARGSQLFKSVGCAACHTPFFTTQSPIAALNGKKSWGFSDWLVHDVGTGDGIVQGSAPANKMRTAPLIDVAHTTAFLHDGSALTPLDAVLHHVGEATPVTATFKKLSPADQTALLNFVKSL